MATSNLYLPRWQLNLGHVSVSYFGHWAAAALAVGQRTASSAVAEIACDGDGVDFSVDNVHSALTLTRPSQTDGTDEPWNDHSRSLKVIRCCANDFLLALSTNLTSLFNRSWDITPSLHLHTPRLFQVELEKDGWE